jgi:hypothetical protein
MDFEEVLIVELNEILRFTDKIYPLTASETETCPYAVYSLSKLEDIRNLNENHTNTSKAVYEINIYEASYKNMKASIKLFKDKLKSFAFRDIGGSGIYVQSITFINIIEIYEPELSIYRANIEFEVFY